MHDPAKVPRKTDGGEPARWSMTSSWINCWARRAAEGVELLGPEGLLSRATKAILERALAGEMTGHLGYDKEQVTATIAYSSPTGLTVVPLRYIVDTGDGLRC